MPCLCAQSYLIPAPHLALPVAALTSPLHRKLYAIRLGVSSLSEQSAATLASVRDELEGEIERLHEEAEEEVVRREKVEKERETALEAVRKGEQLVEEWALKAQTERRRRLTGSPASEYVLPFPDLDLPTSSIGNLHNRFPCAVMRVQCRARRVRTTSLTSDNENERRKLRTVQPQHLPLARLGRLHLQPTSRISLPISDSTTHRLRQREKRHRCGRPRLSTLRVAVIGRRRRNDRGLTLRGTTGAQIVVVVQASTAGKRRRTVATCSHHHRRCRGLNRQRPRYRRRLDPSRLRRLLARRQCPEARHPHLLRRAILRRRVLLGARNRMFLPRLLLPMPPRATLLRPCRVFSPSPTRPPSLRSHSSRLLPLRPPPPAQHLESDPPSRAKSSWLPRIA